MTNSLTDDTAVSHRWLHDLASPLDAGDLIIECLGDKSFELVRSAATGHEVFNPLPSTQALNDFYNGAFSGGGNDVYNLKTQFDPKVIDVADGLRNHMRDFAGFGQHFTMHDFGCAFGNLVYAFQQLGVTATGNEPNRDWVKAGNTYCKGALTDGSLEEALCRLDYKIDLFTALHVFEHLSDPLDAMLTMKENLSPEGIIYICVPNGASIQALLGGRRKDPLFSFPMHLQYFTPSSMASCLRTAGLEPLYCDTRWLPDSLNPADFPFVGLLGSPLDEVVDVEAWKKAMCQNLLGTELFFLAGLPDNKMAKRMLDLDERVERALRFGKRRSQARASSMAEAPQQPDSKA